jgi:transposase
MLGNLQVRFGGGLMEKEPQGHLASSLPYRKNRAARHSWAFHQLRSFVEYKAHREGVPFLEVEKAYSSQECCVCHQIDKKNRTSQSVFQCHNPECRMYRLKVNADHNAAKVLRYRAEVNLPELCLRAEGEAATTEDFGRSVGIGGIVPDASAASHVARPRGS